MPYKDDEKRREFHRQYRELNREKLVEYDRRWSEANRERKAEKNRQYREANLEKEIQRKRQYRKEHPEKSAETNRRYHRVHPEKAKQRFYRRRARIVGNGGSHTEAEFQALCSYYMDQCLCCGDVPDQLTRDHVLPLLMGGTDDISNIQPLCLSCNCRKQARFIDYR